MQLGRKRPLRDDSASVKEAARRLTSRTPPSFFHTHNHTDSKAMAMELQWAGGSSRQGLAAGR